MGGCEEDSDAVVDGQLRVRGVDGLCAPRLRSLTALLPFAVPLTSCRGACVKVCC